MSRVGLRRLLEQGHSITVQAQYLSRHLHPFLGFARGLVDELGLPLALGVIASPPGASAIPPHLDHYDVMVLQLQGSKHWTWCVPKPKPSSALLLNPAERARIFSLSDDARFGSEASMLESMDCA